MKQSKWKQEGMLTVEATWIISITVIVVGIMLSVMFHGYRICWYTQAGCETVLAGSSQGVLDHCSGLTASLQRWNQLKEECYLVPDDFVESIYEKDENIVFSCEGTTTIWGMSDIRMKINVEQRICKPVEYIRKVMKIHNMVGDVYDS